MRNLLIIIKIFIIVLFIAQPVKEKDSDVIKDNTIRNEQTEIRIHQVIRENEQKIAEVQEIRSQNQAEVDKMNKLDIERTKLIKSNRKMVDQIVKMSKKIWAKPDRKNTKAPIVNSKIIIKTDSTCVKYGRDNIFDKKKCEKWEYYTYTEDSDNNRILLK